MTNVRHLILVSAAGLIIISGPNCAARTVYVVKAPPTAKVKVVETPAPWPNAVWVKGHWAWRGARYVWVDGFWAKPRKGYGWVQGHWVNRPRGWIWVAGHWKRVR